MMTKTTGYRLLLWALTLVWCGTILSMSLQSASQSTALSSGLTEQILNLFSQYRELPSEQQASVLAQAQTIARELAHLAEYTILGLLTTLLVRSYRLSRFAAITFGATAVFAVADECLQEFATADRAFQLVDLLKDWLGASFGIGFIWLVCLVAKRINYQRK